MTGRILIGVYVSADCYDGLAAVAKAEKKSIPAVAEEAVVKALATVEPWRSLVQGETL